MKRKAALLLAGMLVCSAALGRMLGSNQASNDLCDCRRLQRDRSGQGGRSGGSDRRGY